MQKFKILLALLSTVSSSNRFLFEAGIGCGIRTEISTGRKGDLKDVGLSCNLQQFFGPSNCKLNHLWESNLLTNSIEVPQPRIEKVLGYTQACSACGIKSGGMVWIDICSSSSCVNTEKATLIDSGEVKEFEAEQPGPKFSVSSEKSLN